MESNKHIFHIFGIGKTQINLSMGNSKIKAVQNNGVNKSKERCGIIYYNQHDDYCYNISCNILY